MAAIKKQETLVLTEKEKKHLTTCYHDYCNSLLEEDIVPGSSKLPSSEALDVTTTAA